jgi:hypothetical protein
VENFFINENSPNTFSSASIIPRLFFLRGYTDNIQLNPVMTSSNPCSHERITVVGRRDGVSTGSLVGLY